MNPHRHLRSFSLSQSIKMGSLCAILLSVLFLNACQRINFKKEQFSHRDFIEKNWTDYNRNFKQESPYAKYSGKWEWYDRGYVEARNHYNEGRVEGVMTMYYTNGVVKSTVPYSNGVRHGEAIDYHNTPDKVIRSKGTYVSNRRHSKWVWYNREGRLISEGTFVSNRVEGDYIHYYSDGKVRQKNFYEKGISHGNYEEYYSDSTLKTKGQYQNAQKEGLWHHYKEDGSLEKTIQYQNGQATLTNLNPAKK